MKAVILAAGEGTRLEPLTNVRPKPMLPVANKPILEHVIEAVAAAGITDVIVVVGYKRERIHSHFGDGDDCGVELSYVVQDPQLGSGDALLQAEAEVGSDVVVLNGDQVVDASAIEAVRERYEQTGDSALAATRSPVTELYGVVDTENGTVSDIEEKPSGMSTDSELINAGVYAFGPGIFAALRETEHVGELSLTDTLRQHLDTHPLRAVQYEGPWFDVTWPWDLLSVNGFLLDGWNGGVPDSATIHETATVVDGTAIVDGVRVQPNATVLRGTTLGRNVSLGANAVVENSIVMSDASIEPGAVIRDCVVGANANIGASSVAEGGKADVVVGDRVHRDVRLGGVVGDNASLGGDVTVSPGTRLGNDSVVESGARLQGRFTNGATVNRG